MDNIYIGRRDNRYAISCVSQELEIINDEEFNQILSQIQSDYGIVNELEIFTNKGIGIDNDNLPENIKITKIPEDIINKFKMEV